MPARSRNSRAPIPLPQPFPSRYGAPILRRVSPRIFRVTYFTHCLACAFCDDWCCGHGVDVDQVHYEQIMARADRLEAYTGIPRERWFTDEVEADDEVPGGASRRTAVDGGGCVFRNRHGRGCLLHAFAIDEGVDFRELKSLVDALFPVSFVDGTLVVADEVADGSLVCLGDGPTVYRAQRSDLAYYFGEELVRVLDEIEAGVCGGVRAVSASTASRLAES